MGGRIGSCSSPWTGRSGGEIADSASMPLDCSIVRWGTKVLYCRNRMIEQPPSPYHGTTRPWVGRYSTPFPNPGSVGLLGREGVCRGPKPPHIGTAGPRGWVVGATGPQSRDLGATEGVLWWRQPKTPGFELRGAEPSLSPSPHPRSTQPSRGVGRQVPTSRRNLRMRGRRRIKVPLRWCYHR